jgi:hypothetical protein
MRYLLSLLLTLVPVGERCDVWAQAAADTLPERVISQAYDAFNRHDPAAFLSFFAPVWYHTVLDDSAAAPRRQVRQENIRDYVARDAFGNKPTICGDSSYGGGAVCHRRAGAWPRSDPPPGHF